jgi:hypothetical protein
LFNPPPAAGALVLTVSTLPSGSSVQVSSWQFPNLELACVPNAVLAADQLLFAVSHTAVWLLKTAPKIIRPSARTEADASRWL